jgi:hypothetical protein
MVEAFDTNYIVGVREEPRLTEQQFGNFQNLATIRDSKQERARFGRFYYRCVYMHGFIISCSILISLHHYTMQCYWFAITLHLEFYTAFLLQNICGTASTSVVTVIH